MKLKKFFLSVVITAVLLVTIIGAALAEGGNNQYGHGAGDIPCQGWSCPAP